MDDNNPSLSPRNINSSPNTYALNGEKMLCSVIIVCVAVVIITCFRSYFRRRHRHLRRSNNLLNPATATTTSPAVSPQGLDLTILKSLPTFIYSATTNKPSLECAVCLSEFEENETGRLLPKCNHAFHIDCIDKWFNSHSNCPLCRVPVQSNIPVDKPELPGSEVAVESSSGLCGASEKEESEVGSSSHSLPVDSRKRPLELAGIIVEVPTVEQRSLEGMSLGSPQGHGFKSPGNRILTMKRIWSI